MSFACRILSAHRVSFFGCAALLSAALVSAQTPASTSASGSGWSSSQSGQIQLAEGAVPARPGEGSAAAPAAHQDDNANSGWQPHDVVHRLTFEAGGGFNAPIGNDTPYITWGGNFTLGAGVRFNKTFSTLLEYQYMDNKLPGAFIAAASEANGGGITGGNSHINSITVSPLIHLTPNSSNGVYLVGGWGYYHKSTNFSAPEAAFDPFYGYYYANVTVASFTSNQWGANAGLGLYHRLGGMYGPSKTEFFAEARYTYIHTPPITQDNGLGTTELIPVTVGFRF